MTIRTLIGITILSCTLPSCVTYTRIQKEPRKEVRYTTAKAAQTLYDAYLESPDMNGSMTIELELPFRYKNVQSNNKTFNAAITAADTDHNGIITQSEADAFAASPLATRPRRSTCY